MSLSKDQQEFYDAIIDSVEKCKRKKFFLTGKAGTGKSHLIREIVKQYNQSEYALLAPTGIAAINIGGVTIHRFCCINFKRNTISHRFFEENMQGRKLIIIDEISMVSKELFEMVIGIMESYGVTIILCGDFLQLPPVEGDYIFESHFWNDVEPFCLTVNHRQSDQKFIDVLEDIRNAKLTDRVEDFVDDRIRSAPKDVIKICPFRKQVDGINNKMLRLTKNEIHESVARVISKADYIDENSMFKSARVPEYIDYSVGSRIMTLTNESNGRWVNGSLGTIRDVNKENVVVEFDNGKTERIYRCEHKISDADGNDIFCYMQYPFVLAWAITIHRSQGVSLDKVAISMSNTFAPGQTYVAFSRCTNPDGLYLNGSITLNPIDNIVLEFVKNGYKSNISAQREFVYECDDVPF